MDQLLKILGNAHKSPFTTIIGGLTILVTLFCVYYPSIGWGWDKAAPGLVLGFTLIFLPDPKKPTSTSAAVILLFASILLVTLLACKRMPSPSHEFTNNVTDSTTIKTNFIPVLVTVPGAKVVVTVTGPCKNQITSGPDKGKFKPFEKKERKGNAQLDIKGDSLGNETIECECLPYKTTIQAKNTIINRLRKELKSTKETAIQYKSHWYDIAARWIAIVSTLILALIIYLKLKP